jgi:hypothetical protein
MQLNGSTGANIIDTNNEQQQQQQLCSTSCWRKTRGHDYSATSSSAARHIQCSCNGSTSSESKDQIHKQTATMQQKQYMMLIDRVLDPMEDALADAERHVTRLLQQRQQHISYTTTSTTTTTTTTSSRISRSARARELCYDDDDGDDEDQDGTEYRELAHYLAHTAGLRVMPISQVMDTATTTSLILSQQAQQRQNPTHHHELIPPPPADTAAAITDRELYVTDFPNADRCP